MIGSLGWPEILFIAVLVLLVFGPRRLPEIGRTMGRFLGEFRRATTDLKRTIDTEVTLEEVRQSRPPSSPASPAAPEDPPAEPVTPEPVASDNDRAEDARSD